jgi:hypothetical protein
MFLKTLFAIGTLSLTTQAFAGRAPVGEVRSCNPTLVTSALGSAIKNQLYSNGFLTPHLRLTPKRIQQYSVSLKNVSTQAIDPFQTNAMTDQAIRMDINIQFRDEIGDLRLVTTVKNVRGGAMQYAASFLAWLSPIQDTKGNPIPERCVLTLSPNPTKMRVNESLNERVAFGIQNPKSKEITFGHVDFSIFLTDVNNSIAKPSSAR